MDITADSQHMVTCDSNMMCKVWRLWPTKVMLRAIRFSTGVQTASILNEQLDLIVGHNNILSLVPAAKYLPQIRRREVDSVERFETQLSQLNEGVTAVPGTDRLMRKLSLKEAKLRKKMFESEGTAVPFNDDNISDSSVEDLELRRELSKKRPEEPRIVPVVKEGTKRRYTTAY